MTPAGGARPDRPVRVALAVVALHLAVTAAHGVAHATIPVPVTDWQGGYTAVVLFGMPVVGAVGLRRGGLRTGATLLLVGGLGALAFEGVCHFLVASPDNVAAVDRGVALFAVTATLSTAVDGLLAATGGWFLWRHRHGSSATAPSVSQT